MLTTLVALLAAATIAVPLTRRAGLGSVLGYLLAGVAIGPDGLGLVRDVQQIADISSLGVVMLLFLVGLELRPRRLWVMRQAVFGMGPAHLLISGSALAVLAHLAGVPWAGSAVLGAGLAMSSTAIVLPMLAERDLLRGQAGRDGFAVLLFQDLAFIPLVAVVPLLAQHTLPNRVPWQDVAQAAAAIAVVLVGGRFVVPGLMRAIGGSRTPELFVTAGLLIVAGSAFIVSLAGLSPSLGAFMAGVLLSQSEYRHELQADIAPFEGLLLGFFFISVGMSADLGLMASHPMMLGLAAGALLLVKIAVGFGVAMAGGQAWLDAVRFSLALPQASEFSFVLFGSAVAAGALPADRAALATVTAAVSMAATPVLFAIAERFLVPRLKPAPKPVFDRIEPEEAPVIICGFGRMGQIVGRVLAMRGIRFTALERDPEQLEVLRRFGNEVYFGDPTRPDMLRAAGADHAKLLIAALDHPEDVVRLAEIARQNFPDLKIIARARNRRHVHVLKERQVDGIVRETYYSSLKMAEMALTSLGVPARDAVRSINLFRDHDERALIAAQPIYRNETELIQSTQQAAEELAAIFEADRQRP